MKRSFKGFLRDYFDFTNGERNGIIVLVLIAIVISIVPMIGFRNRHPEQTDFSLIKSLEANSDDVTTKNNNEEADNFQEYPERKNYPSRFNFDPNTATSEELQSLGFKKYLAERLVKFRNAGGKFYVKLDILKVYGIPPDLADDLMPYIDLPENRAMIERKEGSGQYSDKKYVRELIDINTADTAALNRLKGIGSTLSGRIVSFREKLGGFYSLEQLGEVYGLKPEVLQEIMPRLKPDPAVIRQLDLNTATVEELGKHPYIKKNLAAIIVNYRVQHGSYNSINDLLKIKVLDEIAFNRLKNYLKV